MIHEKKTILSLTTTKAQLQHSLIYFTKVLSSSILLILGARVAFPLPFSPVPVTWQTEALIILSLIWGRNIAAGAVLAYFLEGISGLPVFAEGTFGIWPFFSASGGYLVGFLPAAYLMGLCADAGWTKNVLLTALAVILGKAMIYGCGLLWLSFLVPTSQLLSIGLYPFLGSAAVQVTMAAGIAPALHWIGNKFLKNKRK